MSEIQNSLKCKTKMVYCYYHEDINCSHEIFNVGYFNANYVLCPICKGLGKINPDKRSSKSAKEKRNKTNIELFGDDYTKIHNERSMKSQNELYGGIGRAVPDQEKKFKEGMIREWGVENPMHNEMIVKKLGLSISASSTGALIKRTKTFQDNFGEHITCGFQVPEYRAKGKETLLRNLGVEHPMHSKIIKDSLSKRFHKKFYDSLLNSNRLEGKCIPLFSFEEYDGVIDNEYLWKCNKCNSDFTGHLLGGSVPRCPICFPKRETIGSSLMEQEIYEFCKQFYPNLENNVKILDGKEIDIYIPEIKLGIEFNGLYWHGESMGKDKYYHQNKTFDGFNCDIDFIHIFEDEWISKQEIVKSLLKSKMNVSNNVDLGKCLIKEITQEEAFEFLNENSLVSIKEGLVYLGLQLDCELVALLSIGLSSDYEYEILDYCELLDNEVPGGLMKLFYNFIELCNPLSVIVNADLRFGRFNIYSRSGFYFKETTEPNFYYMKNGKRLKSEELIFKENDNELSEWKNAQLNGYDRIWDSGNITYEWKCD